MFLWRDLDDVAHCRILSPDKTGSLADARYSSIHSCDGTVGTAQTVNGKIGDNNVMNLIFHYYTVFHYGLLTISLLAVS